MRRQRGAVAVGPILLVLGLLGIAVLAASMWPQLTAGPRAELRRATATVLEPEPCARSTRGDLVEVVVDGRPHRVRYDGCGHVDGQRLEVLVPVEPSGEFTALPAGGPTSDRGALADRLNWVLLTLAAVSGGCYAVMLRIRRP
ncbi:hypothetical protein [Saccharopolyspora sp. CA-218241]|uniref:hypothetical protein n=1 Tax=Saccharopolyspora sp. CA-218241 TaxID=3240027 RepID=UPI003D97D7CD